MYLSKSKNSSIINSIIWFNQADVENSISATGSTLEAYFSNIETSTDLLSRNKIQKAVSVIEIDPLFMNISTGDFRLSPNSSSIDAGSNNLVPQDNTDLDSDGNLDEPIPLDILKRPRFLDNEATMDDGQGVSPIIDMGAYEYSKNIE